MPVDDVLDFIEPYFDQWGELIVFAVTFLENSAFVGAVVPGDVVLLLAGLYAERGVLFLPHVMGLAFSGAIMGDSVGYLIGRVAGRRIIDRFGHRFFLPHKRVERMERYFAEQGVWAVAIGRFAPGVRTVNTFVAGMTRMSFGHFLGAVAVAAAIWSVGVPVLGFLFGGSLRFVRRSLGAFGIVLLVLFAVFVFITYRRTVRRLERDDLRFPRREASGR